MDTRTAQPKGEVLQAGGAAAAEGGGQTANVGDLGGNEAGVAFAQPSGGRLIASQAVFNPGDPVMVLGGRSVGIVESTREEKDSLGRKAQRVRLVYNSGRVVEHDSRFLARYIQPGTRPAQGAF